MPTPIKNFLVKLQNSDEAVKKRWLIILSGVAMVAVIGLWVVYFNWSLPEIAATAQVSENPQSLQSALQNIKATLLNGLRSVKNQLGGRNFFEVDVSERNFILENIEEAPEATLPL